MNIQKQVLAGRYAAAFLNLYSDTLTLDDYYAIQDARNFLNDNRNLLTYFKLPRMSEEKKEALQKIFEAFNVPSSLHKLAHLLLGHQRLFLLKEVFDALLVSFRERKHIMVFKITSSHTLQKVQLDNIKNFLEKKTGNTILYNEVLDKKLIAGIRVLSNNYLWEYSIAQQLREAQQALRS